VAQDSDPEQAREIANTVALELDGYVQEINEQNPGSAADTAARLVDPALTPQNRTSPQPAIALALGLVGGFTAGLILMAAIARRDDLLRTESRVEQVTGAPSLGSFLGLAGRRLSPLDVARHRSTTQNFRGIRNNLVERLPSTDNPVVAVLSSESGEGKTSLVLGLARALSYEGRAVLVVDGDLRRHGLTSVLALEDRPGWVGWAEKSGAPGDLVVRDALGSVDVVPVGRRPPSNRSGEDVDLGFKRLQLALDRLRRSYDIVLVDTPNLTSYADSALISRYADGAVLVIPFGQVGPREVTQAIDSVVKAGGEVLGTVMSFTARSSRG